MKSGFKMSEIATLQHTDKYEYKIFSKKVEKNHNFVGQGKSEETNVSCER